MYKFKFDTSCDICSHKVLADIIIDDDECFAYTLFCKHCGVGIVRTPMYSVVGASNDTKYLLNRFTFAYTYQQKIQPFLESEYWIGEDIVEILDIWNQRLKRISIK